MQYSSFITTKTKLSKTLFLNVTKSIAEELSWKFVSEEDNKLIFKISAFFGIITTQIEVYIIGNNVSLLAESNSIINHKVIATFFALYQKTEILL